MNKKERFFDVDNIVERRHIITAFPSIARLPVAFLLALVTMVGQAQTKVTGHVINERGENVEYVSIGIEEDSVGVISDSQGHFTLTIPAGRNDELTFTHVSYQTAIIPYATYTDGNELTVTLRDKVIELAEVVVGKKSKPHTLSGKSWIRTSTAGFEGDCKGDLEWGPIFKNRKDYLLTDIMVSIDKCEYEECLLSFNCYEVRDKQFINVLNMPIYQRVTPADNGKQLCVSPAESVILKGKKKYCVTISVVDIKGKGRLSPRQFQEQLCSAQSKREDAENPRLPDDNRERI